ncbi:TonB-dependent receptor plug domain-containing protein [Hymenobacter arizonensis]|uniref:TonB-dependent outer membrane receptor, SusC/RagA subfamily, signature region n=1 Tax=Hymenobacter arizonensis TaxID=1227077 RepID=A0A1I5WNX2_HYMAR|nr:TonB-dependent receptor plug domain-containing protein [Hymenobacter arizonensis]SFQ21096.1 TonB-dependent outer membrane receptor, SusC/RagA subfamily, signature region [Hymenobacter arizonensis]
MPRILPFTVLFLVAAEAHAQQADTLATATSDSAHTTLPRAGSIPAFTTIQPALSQVAGVQVTPYSGAPGAWATVRIRGVINVTGNSQPLYVVDGVPVYNTEVTPEQWSNAEAFYQRNNYSNGTVIPYSPNANPMLDMPVADVARIEVLKGAAATARYGAQGANGVVVISTRRGAGEGVTPQPLRVRYTAWGGLQQVRQRYELLGARQYAELVNAARAGWAPQPPYSATALDNLGEEDWQKRVFRVAGIQSHNLSLDGQAHHTSYYAAADYLRQAGVVDQSSLNRYHLRLNLNQHLTPKLTVGLNASASQTDQRYAGSQFHSGRLLQDVLFAKPAVLPGAAPSTFLEDPLRDLNYYRATPRTQRLLAQLNATYRFNDDWLLTLRGSREQVDARALGYSPVFIGQNLTPPVEQTSTSTTNATNWVANAALRYQHTFANQHAVVASLDYLRQQFKRTLRREEYLLASNNGFGFDMRGYYEESQKALEGIQSPSGSIGYTYAGRYELQASMRADFILNTDDFSKTEYNWSPGGQLSWHLHKEAFLAGASGLSDFTLWAGTGRTRGFFYDKSRTTHHDAGLRLGLLEGHLTLEAGIYQRRTLQAQAMVPVGIMTGSGPSIINMFPDVTLLNQGLELTVGSTWQRGPLQGTTHLAAATNRNRVASLSQEFFIGGSGKTLQNGQPISSFYVFDQDGIYPSGSARAGSIRYRDRNNDGEIDYRDGYASGSGLPRYTLALTQQLRLHHYQLDAQFDGLFGYQILNTTLITLDTPTGSINSSPRALDYWTPANPNTSVPRAGSTTPFNQINHQSLESGNHLRLSQLTLSYEVLNTGTRQASVWVGGQNLFVTGKYRGYDPNVSSGGASPLLAGQDASVYPVARVWQVGVRGAF